MKAGILGLIIIFSSICIAFFIIVKKNPSSKPISQIKSILPAQIKSYKNSNHHFGFSYPMNLSVSENGEKSKIIISTKTETKFIIQVVASSSALIKKTPLQYILDLCKESNISAKCSLDSQSVITSNSGAGGSSYYLKKMQLVLKNIVGPFAIFPLPSNSSYQSGFIIFYPKSLSLPDADKEDFITIIKTLTLPQLHADISPIGSSSAQ